MAIKTKLLPHQERALARALKDNILLAHSMGSGKTLTSIAIADALGQPTTVLTPASLVENYKKELKKHKKGGPPVEVISLPTAVSRNYKIPKGNTVVIDEAHSLRNSGTQRLKYLKSQLKDAGRIIGLTGTPAYNDIANWAPLVNVVSQMPIFPENKAEFENNYIKMVPVHPELWGRRGIRPSYLPALKNTKHLQERLNKYVDVFDTDVDKPERIEKYIKVPMNPDQYKLYKQVSKNIPANVLSRLNYNLPPNRTEAQQLNSFLSGVRQVSNTPTGYAMNLETGSKIKASVEELLKRYRKNPSKFRALVYSNYLDSGVGAIAKELDKESVPYEIFNGSLSAKKKKEIVDRYNRGELPIILGTGSASEGLDLKNTNLIQILEPHFNNSKLEQVIGRGIRYKSHEDLPPEERKVLVQRFLAEKPVTWMQKQLGINPGSAVDVYLDSRAKEKDALIAKVKSLLQS